MSFTVPAGFYAPPEPTSLANVAGATASGSISVKAIGSVQPTTEALNTYDYTPGGELGIVASTLENLGSEARFEDGIQLAIASAVSSIAVDDGASGANVVGVIARAADAMSGIVEDAAPMFHCAPLCTTLGGHFYMLHRGMYNGVVAISRNGKPWAVLPNTGVDASDIELNDSLSYHHGGAICVYKDGLAVFRVDHNKRIYMLWGQSASDFTGGTWTAVGPDSRPTTYVHAAPDERNSRIWVFSRVSSTALGNPGGSLLRIDDADGTPSLGQEDFLHTTYDVFSQARLYPRHCSVHYLDSSNTRVAIGWHTRNGTTEWLGGHAAVYDVEDNDWRNLAGTDVGGANLGTPGTPRFSSTEMTNDTHGGGGGVELVGSVANKIRYIPAIHIEHQSGELFRAVAVLCDVQDTTTNPNLYYTDVHVRLGVWYDASGTYTRVVSTNGGDELGLDGASTYRITAEFIGSGDTLKLLICERGTERPETPGNATADDQQYYSFGAHTADGTGIVVAEWDLSGALAPADAAALATAISGERTAHTFATNQSYLGIANVFGVEGVDDAWGCRLQVGAAVHQSHKQSIPVLNDVAFAAFGTDGGFPAITIDSGSMTIGTPFTGIRIQ